MDKKEKEIEAMVESAPADMPKEVLDQVTKVVKEAKQASKEEKKETIKWFWKPLTQGTFKREIPKVLSRKRLRKLKQKERRALPLPKNIFKVNSKEKYNRRKTLERLMASS